MAKSALIILAAVSLPLFFAGCLQQQAPETQGQCGGVAGIKCPEGFVCYTPDDYPDAAGQCIPKYVDRSGQFDNPDPNSSTP